MEFKTQTAPMEITPLAEYLNQKIDEKKVHKRVNRAIKLYRHALRDMTHAAKDLEHAKADCAHAIAAFEQTILESKERFEEWLVEDEEGIELIEDAPAETPGEAAGAENLDDADDEDDAFDDDDEDEMEERLESALDDLEHAGKDFKHAVKDSHHAVDDLAEVEYLLLEILDLAEDDGISINLVEAKAYIAAQAAVVTEKPEN